MISVGDENARGPTVTMTGVTYRIIDPRSPLGHKHVLTDITAKFDWGKLCVVMGAKDSGKSTLLHVISGSRNNAATNISGSVLFDGKKVLPYMKAWQRAGFVEALDEHFRDLTVFEVITYAMKLRCYSSSDLDLVESNVQKTLELLRLLDVQHVPAKLLSKGDRRRLSIAEEAVNGPSILLLDEPITGLASREAALIMNSLRELVNQEKTVIAAMHEPSSEVYTLFDTIVLLSKGRVIYIGAATDAVDFFSDDPLKIVSSGHQNPADFLTDVSACILTNVDGSYLDTPALSSNWRNSARYIDLEDNIQRSLLLLGEIYYEA